MTKQKLDLIKDPIPHLIIKMAIPVSIGFFFHTMFNVVDTYFASQISSVAVAALTITFPIFFMIQNFKIYLAYNFEKYFF